MATIYEIDRIRQAQAIRGSKSVRVVQTNERFFEDHALKRYTDARAEKIRKIRSRGATIMREDDVVGSRKFWKDNTSSGYTRLARGYAELTEDEAGLNRASWTKEEDRHLHLIDYLSQRKSATAIADLSAAILWGLPILGHPPHRVQRVALGNITVHHSRNQQTRRCHIVPKTVSIEGIRVTTIEQTLVDIACIVGSEAALVAADYALHEGITSLARITEVAENQGRRPGIGNLRKMLEVADGRVESPAESRMRWRFHCAHHEVPLSQVAIIARGNVYRVDGYDPRTKTIYEIDGKGKYDLHEEGLASAFHAERMREEELRGLGFTVHRLRWDDVVSAAAFSEWKARVGVVPSPRRKKAQQPDC